MWLILPFHTHYLITISQVYTCQEVVVSIPALISFKSYNTCDDLFILAYVYMTMLICLHFLTYQAFVHIYNYIYICITNTPYAWYYIILVMIYSFYSSVYDYAHLSPFLDIFGFCPRIAYAHLCSFLDIFGFCVHKYA